MTDKMLVDQLLYKEVGIHLGTKVKTQGMKRFIEKVREDGLYTLDLETIDARLKLAAQMLAKYDPSQIVVTASRIYSITAATKFAEITKAKLITGRVMPGIFTNPNREDFIEPEIILISDNRNERQAVKEASKTNIPIIALCDTDNWMKFVDLVIPCNNKGRRSLSLIYFILAREFLKEKGIIKSNEEFNYKLSDFEAEAKAK